MTSLPTETPSARDIVQEIAGCDVADKIKAQVAGDLGVGPDEVEDAFQEACIKAIASGRGLSRGEIAVYLAKVTRSQVRDTRARHKHERSVPDPFEHDARRGPSPADLLLENEYTAEVKATVERLGAGLGQRQQVVLALFCRRARRRQIADVLSIKEKRVERDVADILRRGRNALVAIAGHGCSDGEQLITTAAFGLPGADRVQAQLHMASCAQCCALYERLELFRNKAAAITPAPAIDQAQPHLLQRGVDRLGEIASGVKQHATDAVSGMHGRASETVTNAKGHATGIYTRATDATPLAAARPGAAATAVAGCLAIGGGGAYCVQQNVDPLQGLAGVAAPEKKPAPKPPEPKATAVDQEPTPTPSVVTTPAPTPEPAQTNPAPAATPSTHSEQQQQQQSVPAPTAADEFQPIAPSQSAAPATSAGPRQQSKPAPAPSSGPNEFGP